MSDIPCFVVLIAVGLFFVAVFMRRGETIEDEVTDDIDVSDDGSRPTDIPPTVRRPSVDEKMVSVLETRNTVEADLLRNALLRNDIYAFVSGGSAANVLGPAGLASVTLRVPDGDLERAKQVIAETLAEVNERRQAGGRLFCPACGYDLRGQSERCPECGLSL
ncbi:MAG: DUF2007 domain-containing protein [Planctomycetota bacterium]